jgi:glycosyltransferase involved in cell wall biosynthesis
MVTGQMAVLTPDAPIGVVVPVFNGARYLHQTLQSVTAQSCPAVSLIVVDDGSTDGSAEIAARFAPEVVTLRRPHEGQAAALNAGLAAASGTYVAFLDADDLWLPEKLARQTAQFSERPELEYCVTRIQNFLSPEYESRRAEIDPALFQEAPGYVVSTLMARRALFDRIGGFDEGLQHANKTEWFLRARSAGVAGEMIGEVLVRRRLHATNVSQNHAQQSLEEYLRLVKTSLDRRREASS